MDLSVVVCVNHPGLFGIVAEIETSGDGARLVDVLSERLETIIRDSSESDKRFALWILKDDAHFGDKIVMFEPFRKAFPIISQEIIGVSHKSQLLI